MIGFDDLATVQLLFWILFGVTLLGATGLGFMALHYRRQASVLGADKMHLVRDLEEQRREESHAGPSLELWAAETSAPVLRPNAALRDLLGLEQARDTSLDALCAGLASESAQSLEQAIVSLLADGETFNLTLALKEGARRFAVNVAGARPSWRVTFSEATGLARCLEEAEAEARALRGMIDALAIPVWSRGADLSLVDCNRAYCEAIGATREEVLSGELEFLGRSQISQARALARKAAETDGPMTKRSHVVVSGARRLMEIREQRIDEGRLLGVALDKTELEEAQSKLRRHVEAQAEVLENLGTAIAIFGADLHLTFYNTAYVRLWGVGEAIFQNRPHLGDVLEALREHRRLPEHPDFPAYKRGIIKTYTTLIESREELLHLPDGMTLRMLVIPHPLGGVLLSYEDVTDRLAIERSYSTLIEVQRETLDNLYEGVAVYGADGLLKLWNPAFAAIWKIPKEALNGQPHVRELIGHSRDLLDLGEDEWAVYTERVVAETTDPTEASGRRERVDGSVIDWARVPLPDGAVLYTFVDVTDSLQVERALLERNEALETADRLKSEFIANISYELRTPLNAIIGFAEILTNQFFGALNDRQLEYSEAIVESSQRLITLINDILDLASIEAGYMHIDRADVDVRELIEALFALGRERAHNRELELVIDCPDDIGTISADARRLKQALFNVLSNALNFTPKGGQVTLSAKRDDAELLFEVTDTGVGIPDDDQRRVFGRFERSRTQGHQSGAGLGLALVQSLIELHGGRVEMRSKVDGGTRVTCRLPEDGATAEKAPA
jgi:signal transduction histidine kinase